MLDGSYQLDELQDSGECLEIPQVQVDLSDVGPRLCGCVHGDGGTGWRGRVPVVVSVVRRRVVCTTGNHAPWTAATLGVVRGRVRLVAFTHHLGTAGSWTSGMS